MTVRTGQLTSRDRHAVALREGTRLREDSGGQFQHSCLGASLPWGLPAISQYLGSSKEILFSEEVAETRVAAAMLAYSVLGAPSLPFSYQTVVSTSL